MPSDDRLIADEPEKESDEERLARFKTDIEKDSSDQEDQRERANAEMRFIYTPGGHWEDWQESQFSNRTKIQLDITSDAKNRFIANYNNNRMGMDFKPDDDATTDKDAEFLAGVARKDFSQHGGKNAQDNAVDEVAVVGYGAIKLATKFEDPEDPENQNQRVVFREVYEAYNTIYWDRAAKAIDKSDARYVTELEEFTEDSYKIAFPDASAVSAFEPRDRRWMNDRSSTTERIFVATRYEIVKRKETFHLYNNLETGKVDAYSEEDHEKIKDELAANELMEFEKERKIIRQRVMKTVFSGGEILEETREIPGKHLPIIPFYGFRGYVDGVEFYIGLVRRLMDPQRLFNVFASKLAEKAASHDRDTPILDQRQVENPDVRATWENDNLAYKLLDPLPDVNGNLMPPAPIGYTKPSQLDPSIVAIIGIITEHVQQITGGMPQDSIDPNSSGKALNAMLKRENQNTQDMMDNIANAVKRMGEVYQAIASDIYNTPRSLRTLGKDGIEGKVSLLGQVLDEETGELVTANVLSGKRFMAFADTGPLYDTDREQSVEELKGMLDALSQTEAGAKYTPAIIAMILQNITGPNLEPLKKIVRQDMMIQGLIDPETDEEKQFVQQAQQPKDDPQAQLAKSLGEQAESEGRERDSKVLVNTADASKKAAEEREILAGIEMDQAKTEADILSDQQKNLLAIRKQIFEDARQLPLAEVN